MQIADELNRLFGLEGRVALITGGSGVLGRAIARGLGLSGAKVALAGRDEAKAETQAAVLREQGIEALGVAMDATDDAATTTAVELVERELGPISILVNAAGGNVKESTITPDNPFFTMPKDAITRVVDINLYAGAIGPTRIVGAKMKERGEPGSIINVSSMSAYHPLTRVLGYSAAKAAVNNFTEWLSVHFALELKMPVRVNAIAPGFFLTDQNRALLTDGDGLSARGQQIIDHTPMGRFGEPDELIGAVLYLASDASQFVTGVVLPVDGGFNAYSGV